MNEVHMNEVQELIERLRNYSDEEAKDFLLIDLYERYGKDKFSPYLLLTSVVIRLLNK